MRRLLVLLLLFLCACNSSTGIDDKWADPETIQYAASLGVDLSTMNLSPSGLYWKDKVVGEADTAEVGDNVRIHYTGWLPDGTQFDTSRNTGPVEFLLGLGFVMTGLDEGVIGMRVGGIRQLVIRPSLTGFGPGSHPAQIPRNTTLIVEVERLTTPAH
ncbi:MAG TPA: FKBP-type peptidyl-prolyl cis-trans isomerase [Longimicrobiales bacterium]